LVCWPDKGVPSYIPPFLQGGALCANFETKKITTVAGCLYIDAKMWQ